jgi:hypothetical protein
LNGDGSRRALTAVRLVALTAGAGLLASAVAGIAFIGLIMQVTA